MTVLNEQMQGAMDAHFSNIRIDTMIEKVQGHMLQVAEDIRIRPSFDGCDALEKTQNHSLVKRNKDDSGFKLMEMASGGGSLISMAVGEAVDVYSNRKATQARPQDKKKYSAKQEAAIRDKNCQSLTLFQNLNERLNTLQAFKSCGVTRVDIKQNDELRPSMEKMNHDYKADNKPSHDTELEQAVHFRQTPKSRPSPGMAA